MVELGQRVRILRGCPYHRNYTGILKHMNEDRQCRVKLDAVCEKYPKWHYCLVDIEELEAVV